MSVGAAVQLMRLQGLEWGSLFADPADIGGYPVYTGVFTYLGVLALATATGVLAFTALRIKPLRGGTRSDRRLLGAAALLSALLAIDDLFQFHERVLRHSFGIHEIFVYLIFAVLGLVILALAGRRCLTFEFAGFWIAAALLIVSLLADVVEDKANPSALQLLVEEVSKYAGLFVWLLFWWRFCHAALDGTIVQVHQKAAGAKGELRLRPSGDQSAV